MKCKCIKRYNDTKLKRLVTPDEEIEVSDSRGNELIKAGVAIEVTEAFETDVPEKEERKTESKAPKGARAKQKDKE